MSYTAQAGTQRQLTATARKADGTVITSTGTQFTWLTNNSLLATVSATGLVTHISAGTVVITARYTNPDGSFVMGTTTVTVTAADPVPVEGDPRSLLPFLYTPPTGYVETGYTFQHPYAARTGTKHRLSAGTNIYNLIVAGTIKRGDDVELISGARYPALRILDGTKIQGTSGYINIYTEAHPDLPTDGERAYTQAHFDAMAKIETNINGGSSCALEFNTKAHHIRVQNVALVHNNTYLGDPWYETTAVVRFLPTDTTDYTTFPNNIVLDRVMIDNPYAVNARALCMIAAQNVAVINCSFGLRYIPGNGCAASSDPKAIGIIKGARRIEILNNFLAGSGEIILIGGSDSTTGSLQVQDVVIRRNHFFKHKEWRTLCPEYMAVRATAPVIKNNFEMKEGTRVLVEGNVGENTWSKDQDAAINIKSVSQEGRNTNAQVKDVTFRNNLWKNSPTVTKITAHTGDFPTLNSTRIQMIHNLFYDVGGDGQCQGTTSVGWKNLFLQGLLTEVQYEHNTCNGGYALVEIYQGGLTSTRVISNIHKKGSYNVRETNVTVAYEAEIRRNVMFAGTTYSSTRFPDNRWYSTKEAVKFVNYDADDYHLQSDSPAKAYATDGTDAGCNVDEVLRLTNGVVIPL